MNQIAGASIGFTVEPGDIDHVMTDNEWEQVKDHISQIIDEELTNAEVFAAGKWWKIVGVDVVDMLRG